MITGANSDHGWAPLVSSEAAKVAPPGDPDPRTKLADLESQLYEHVRTAIDFDALYQLEQTLWGLLDLRGMSDADGELAKSLLADAAARAVRDPESFFHVSPPPGITKEEEQAATFDPACSFCQMEAELRAYECDPAALDEREAEEASLRELYADDARRWREKHAAQLARARRAASPQPRQNGESRGRSSRRGKAGGS